MDVTRKQSNLKNKRRVGYNYLSFHNFDVLLKVQPKELKDILRQIDVYINDYELQRVFLNSKDTIKPFEKRLYIKNTCVVIKVIPRLLGDVVIEVVRYYRLNQQTQERRYENRTLFYNEPRNINKHNFEFDEVTGLPKNKDYYIFSFDYYVIDEYARAHENPCFQTTSPVNGKVFYYTKK